MGQYAPNVNREDGLPVAWVLASASPRRKSILEAAGFRLDIRAADADEAVPPGESFSAVAEIIATRKARAIARAVSTGYIVAADTIVVVGNEILGKPNDAADARRMLRSLSGSTHFVITGVAIVERRSGHERIGSQLTSVTMRNLLEHEIDDYVASGEPFGKAGGYAIQESADRFVSALHGDFDNVVGFPLRTFRALAWELVATVKETPR